MVDDQPPVETGADDNDSLAGLREASQASSSVARPAKLSPAANSPRGSVSRLSLENSHRFASIFQDIMKGCHLSVYALFVDLEFPRSTLTRWVSGKSRIPVDAALTLVEALREYADRVSNSSALRELDAIVCAERVADSGASKLRAELRARRVPIRRTLEALRAVSLLPSETSVG